MRRLKLALIGLGVLALAVFALVAQAPAQDAFSPTAPMATPRATHRATLLTWGPNAGKVLVVGGQDGITVLASAELYDPATGMWSSTGSLGTPRSNTFTATVLPSGKVLVAGGRTTGSVDTATAELYDPGTGMWAPTGSLIGGERRAHIAVLLPNGKVLVAGGEVHPPDITLATAELYDPATGTWSSTGSLSVSRTGATAVLLPNGKVLVAGGVSGGCCGTGFFTNTAELYDPETGSWTPTGNMATARSFSNYERAKLLPNGKVLVAGEQTTGNVMLATAELYDPVTGTWSFTGSMATPRQQFSTTLLPNGRVLVAGGDDNVATLYASAEVYDPATGTWSSAGSLGTARSGHSATLLPNGEVLVAGGGDVVTPPHSTASAEVLAPSCNTPAGSNVRVTPVVGVSLTFSTVSAQGATSVTTSSTGPATPAGFSFGDPPTYYDIQTTAMFTGVVTVCIAYDPTRYIAPLRLFHYENNAWADVTMSNDTTNHVICGAVSSLSPFAVAGNAFFTFTGFFRPVENLPVFNALKAGAAVPVKFSLAGNQGLTIFSAGYPKSQTIACDPTAIVEGVDETITAGASSLSYDAATDQYVYVWKTSAAWANTCRQLVLKLSDGIEHRADFTFKK